MADTTTLEKNSHDTPRQAAAVSGKARGGAFEVAQTSGKADADLQVPQVISERLSKDVQSLPQAAAKDSAALARVSQPVTSTLPRELVPVEAYIKANIPLATAMPLVDVIYGGGILVLVVIVQAIGVHLLNGHFDKRSQSIQKRPSLWRVELLFAGAVFMLLSLHLGSVILWAAAVVYGGIIPDWVQATRFAARSYTTIGSDHQVPDEWHMLGPIIAISGMFTFAWTASVLVTIVNECNHLRRQAWDARRKRRDTRKDAQLTPPPGN